MRAIYRAKIVIREFYLGLLLPLSGILHILMIISELEPIMNSCSNLYFLSTIACRLSDCLSEKELAVLSADLVVLSDMIANMLARDELCKKQKSSDL